MAKGVDFEEKALVYLKYLFGELGFYVTEARQQSTGTQNGFDLRIGFLDDDGKERRFYFECKDYTTKISWDDISVKINQLDASSHEADSFIAISPRINFSNINVNVLEKQQERVGVPIKYWTPETNVRDYFSLDDAFYESVYGSKPGTVDRASLLNDIRRLITDMLRQKDEMTAAAGTPIRKELTVKLPRIDPDNVVGRDGILKELHSLLFNNEKVVVVNGMGGIGKTTVAQAYMSKYYSHYKHIVWISQATSDITNDIISAEGLSENLSIDREGKDSQQLFMEIMRQLKNITGMPNLLILDNADENLGRLKAYLPGPPGWHVLTTSRAHIEGFRPKELEFLPEDDAIELFKKHCTLITDEKQIGELVKTVDYHTLTIEILAKTAQVQRRNIDALKKAIADDIKANVPVSHNKEGSKIEKVRSYLSSIFNLGVLEEDEKWLMKQFASLPAEYHTYDLLLELINPCDDKKEAFPETLYQLAKQGWLMHNTETDAYKMHMVVQEVARQQLKISLADIKPLAHRIIDLLHIDQAKDNPIDKFKWVPFGYTILYSIPSDTSDAVSILQNNLALVLKELGHYEQAQGLLQEAIFLTEKNFGTDHPTTATSYSNLANVLRNLRQYEQAWELLQKAMLSDEKNFGEDHPTTTTRYSNMALVLKDLKKYEQAKELLQKVVLSDENFFGTDHPNTATSYSNLALVLKDIGQYEEAQKLLQKAVLLDEKNFGPDHLSTAISYSNLALVLISLKQYKEALKLAGKALAVFRKTLPDGHPYIGRSQEIFDHIKANYET